MFWTVVFAIIFAFFLLTFGPALLMLAISIVMSVILSIIRLFTPKGRRK